MERSDNERVSEETLNTVNSPSEKTDGDSNGCKD